MNKIYHKFLIIFSILVIVGGIYFYFSNSLTSEASLSSSLDASLVGNSSDIANNDNRINSDIAFISTLTSLNRIKIDTTLFTKKSFQSLNDNTVKLEPGIPGRINPFSPINLNSIENNISSSPILTNEPLEVKSKTAILSGSVNRTTGVTDTFFEYGVSESLGQKTPQATVSLIGTFISNITGLNSKTTYFYKACAKINGATICGDVVSFDTN